MFHELRYVYEVYKERSFSKAAQRLYISQPSLSAMVKRAETRIGSPIFDRSTSPVGLTPAGRAYILAAERMMEIEDGFRRYLSDAEKCLTGSIAIGGTTLFTSYILPPLISRFSAKYPAVEIRLHETHTVALQRELADGELDLIAENCDFDPETYGWEPLRREELLLMVPADRAVNAEAEAYRLSAEDVRSGAHLSDDRPAAPLEVFREEPFLLLKEGNDTRARADRLAATARFRPKPRLLLDQQITAYNLALYGMGDAFISDTLVTSVPPAAGVWFYKLDGALARREIRLYYKRSRYLTSAVKEFLNTARQAQNDSAGLGGS
jgi:DNA-binding transcriptional LysR family regulator